MSFVTFAEDSLQLVQFPWCVWVTPMDKLPLLSFFCPQVGQTGGLTPESERAGSLPVALFTSVILISSMVVTNLAFLEVA